MTSCHGTLHLTLPILLGPSLKLLYEETLLNQDFNRSVASRLQSWLITKLASLVAPKPLISPTFAASLKEEHGLVLAHGIAPHRGRQ